MKLFLPVCLVFILSQLVFAEDLIPIDEGWVRIGTPRALSRERPLRLCVWGFGRSQDVRLIYLKFDLGALPPNAQVGDLVLASAQEKMNSGIYTLYGLPAADWDSSSLTGQGAPGWDVSTQSFTKDTRVLAEATVSKSSGDQELCLPLNSEFESFLKENRGRPVTFILAKKGDGNTMIPTLSDPERGPRLRWSAAK